MSSPFRMLALIGSTLMVMIAMITLFFLSITDDKTSSTIQQTVLVQLNVRDNRDFAKDVTKTGDVKTRQETNSQFYLNKPKFENAVYESLAKQLPEMSIDPLKNYPGQDGLKTDTFTYSKYRTPSTSKAYRHLMFTYLVTQRNAQVDTGEDVQAVKVQTFVKGRPYTINVAVIHKYSGTNYGINDPNQDK